jgi:hypothetical protein
MATEPVVVEAPKAETTQELINRIRAEAKAENESLFEVWKAKELASLAEAQEKVIKEEVAKLVKDYQEKQKPLTQAEIQKMLEQEYVEVNIRLMVDVENADTPQERNFVIRELPQSIERKFYRQFMDKVKAQAPKLAAFTQRNMDQPFEKVMGDFMEAFDGGFDILAGAVAIILNPFEKDKEVTAQWIADHVSLNRQYSIVMAQVEVNKLRDFFARVFRSGQQVGTILTPQDYRSLLGR